MDPAKRQQDIERLKQQHAHLEAAMVPSVAPEREAAPVVSDSWTKETRKALDLSDATVDSFQEAEREQSDEYTRTRELLAQYQRNLNRFLGQMQSMLIEAIEHLEVLESQWQRLK